jgi:hypothetical protein
LSEAAGTLTGLPDASVNESNSSFAPLLTSPFALESVIVVSPDLVDLMTFSPPEAPPECSQALKTKTENAMAIEMAVDLIFTICLPQHIVFDSALLPWLQLFGQSKSRASARLAVQSQRTERRLTSLNFEHSLAVL